MGQVLGMALLETFYMVIFSTVFSLIIGFALAIILTVTRKDGFRENKTIYKIIDTLINVLRSFPFIILIFFLIPVTKIVMGTFIGSTAFIVPLTVGASPFVARVIDSALKEVNPGVIEAAKSFGASDAQIIFKVMLKEAIPSIISGITLTLITIVGYSAMAGVVGGGGLGDVAIRYGFHRYETNVMIVTVIIIIIIVQIFQSLGNYFYNKLR